MKTSEKLLTLIEMGHWVDCVNMSEGWHKRDWHKVFVAVNRPNGKFSGTFVRKTSKECLGAGFSHELYSAKEIDENWKIIDIVTPLPKLPKPGDKVRILESARDLLDFDRWESEQQECVGKCLEVNESIAGGVEILVESKKGRLINYWLPYHVVAPVFDDEIETIEHNGKKYNRAEFEEAINNLQVID